ncbi:hypothetical protein MUK72_09170 [Halococcus dombrowskii]|uniref:Uncharacterized protein n=1 Tax=Halococcus dombrowskii TaxID=179637 RepID=A0AAV3SDU8_HALDO|nr:hypothetical protein [Halococcus dombrowskii]UOO94141.1 hypothetical protein MUK72_09170 [Halococcus dombrowskii]
MSTIHVANTRAVVESLSYRNAPIDRTPARDDAVLAAYKYLITHRSLSRFALVGNVYPMRDAGLGAREWYDALIVPLLADLPGVSPPGPGTALWRYEPASAV